MSSHREVLKHSGYLLGARLFARLVTMPFTVYVAATLKPELFGVFTFSIVTIEMLSSLGDVGLSRYGPRSMVREEVRRDRLAGILLLMQLITSVVLIAIAYTVVFIISPESPKKEVILVGLVALLFSSFIYTTDTMFTAAKRFGAAAIMQVIGKITYLILGFTVLAMGYSVVAVMAAYIASMGIESLLRMLYARLRVTRFSGRFSFAEFSIVVKGTLPFAVTGIATLVYYRADTVILEFLRGDHEVGIYGVAYSFFSFFVWVPIVLSRALLPGLTQKQKDDPLDGKANSWFWYRVSVTGGIAIAYMVTVVARPVIELLMPPGYDGSVLALQILIWSIPLMMMVSVGLIILSISDQERLGARASVVSAIVIIVFDFALIAPFGVTGAAVAMVMATAVLYILIQWILSRTVWLPEHNLVRMLAFPLIGLASMAATGFALMPLGVFATLPAGIVVFGLVNAAGLFLENKQRRTGLQAR